MSSRYPPIPGPSLAYARNAGLSETKIVKLWEYHCDGSREKGYATAGGRPWMGLIDKAKDDDDSGVELPSSSEAEAVAKANAEAKRKAKDIEDAGYEREAIPFAAYLDSLMTRKGPLTIAEERLLEAGGPPSGTDMGEWVMNAVAGPKNAKTDTGPRAQRCRCGNPAHEWRHLLRRYFATDCKNCIDIAKRNKERAAQAHKQQGSGAA